MNRGRYFIRCVVFGIIAIAIVGYITMLLWNWLVPKLFTGPEITYFQALGVLLLSKILFWGLGGKRHGYSGHGSVPYWKQRYYEKFSNMSEAEREAFKKKMKDKWCGWEQRPAERDTPLDSGKNVS
jgi:hypothetical protein